MESWGRYFLERFNPLLSLAVIIGMAMSGVVLDGNLFQPISFVVACLTVFYIAFYFRLHNDIEDYEKDAIAFPGRPLPRGLLSIKEAKNVRQLLEYGLIIYAVILFILYNGNTRTALLLAAIYLCLMRYDFFAKKWLQRHPLISGCVQQGFIFFLTLLVISIGRPELVFTFHGFSYALLTFTAFFTFDICRKLNPHSHPVTMAYVHFFGFKATFWILCALLLISATAAFDLGVQLWLWPAELTVFFALLIILKDPKKFRIAEFAAALSLLIHTWAGPIQHIQG